MVLQAKEAFHNTIFREIMITACWIIWKIQNKIIFDNGQKCITQWKRQFKDELGLVCTRARESKSRLISLWGDSYN